MAVGILRREPRSRCSRPAPGRGGRARARAACHRASAQQLRGQHFLGLGGRQVREEPGASSSPVPIEGRDVLVDPAEGRVAAVAHQVGGGPSRRGRAAVRGGVAQQEVAEVDLRRGVGHVIPGGSRGRDPVGVPEVELRAAERARVEDRPVLPDELRSPPAVPRPGWPPTRARRPRPSAITRCTTQWTSSVLNQRSTTYTGRCGCPGRHRRGAGLSRRCGAFFLLWRYFFFFWGYTFSYVLLVLGGVPKTLRIRAHGAGISLRWTARCVKCRCRTI